MPQSILSPLTFLPHDSVQLGRLISDIQQPHADFLDPYPVQQLDILVQQLHSFRGEESKTDTKSFGSALCHLLSLNRSKERGIRSHVTADQVTTYLLKNSSDWFHRAVSDDKARQWLEGANRRGDDIFLITGYRTLLNARVYESGSCNTAIDGNATMPLAETLTAVGVPVILSSIDPSVTVGQQRQATSAKSFLTKGEHVGAIQYRRVQFKWYSRGKLHDKPLGRNMWEAHLTFRGENDNIIEVELRDDLGLKDDPSLCVYDEDEALPQAQKWICGEDDK